MSILLNERFASKVLYGLVAVIALLVVMELHPPGALEAILTLFVATLAIAMAEAYSETIAAMLVSERRPTAAEMRHLWSEVTPIISSAQPSMLVLAAALLGLISVEGALQLAQLVSIALLFLYGFRVGQLLHGTLLRQVFTGLLMASAGLLIVLIKVLFH